MPVTATATPALLRALRSPLNPDTADAGEALRDQWTRRKQRLAELGQEGYRLVSSVIDTDGVVWDTLRLNAPGTVEYRAMVTAPAEAAENVMKDLMDRRFGRIDELAQEGWKLVTTSLRPDGAWMDTLARVIVG